MLGRSQWRVPARNWEPDRAKVRLPSNRITTMRKRRFSFVITAALMLILIPAFSAAQGQRGGGRGGRGAQPKPPSAPTPHWSDGRVNLDAAPGQKGFCNVMQGNVFGRSGTALPTNLTLDEVPFQDWARALY